MSIKFNETFKYQDGITFKDHRLYLDTASVGNIGQLAIDLLLTNVIGTNDFNPVKIGRVFHPALEAVVGTELSQIRIKNMNESKGQKGTQLMTSCEVFLIETANIVVFHFRAPVSKKKGEDFVNFLTEWIEKQNFEQVVCFSSVYASDRIDSQLTGVPFRFLATESTRATFIEKLTKFGWKTLEKRQFPAPAILSSEELSESKDAVLHLPGSGITKQLYESCQQKGTPFIALIMFASEGDNFKDAFGFFEVACQVFDLKIRSDHKAKNKSSPLLTPESWDSFCGSENVSTLIY